MKVRIKISLSLIIFGLLFSHFFSPSLVMAACNTSVNNCGVLQPATTRGFFNCFIGTDVCQTNFLSCSTTQVTGGRCCVGPDKKIFCEENKIPTPTPPPTSVCNADACGTLVPGSLQNTWGCTILKNGQPAYSCGDGKFTSCTTPAVTGGVCCTGPNATALCKNPPTDPGAKKSTDKKPYVICDQIPEKLTEMKQDCMNCVGKDDGFGGIWTAIGCIPRDPETIVSVFLRFGLGMGGGVALLMILGSGFMLTVSQGDPKQTDTAKQWLTSAISGLLFIIFSVTILQFIGYNIFQIPGFGG